MNNPIIIHISDLHISDHTGKFMEKNEHSLLSSDFSNPANISFIEKFIKNIKSDFPNNEFILLITGDIANVAEKIEYDAAKFYINKIITDLSISKNKVLLLPGDHDVDRISIKNLLRDDTSSPTSEEINKAKFLNFSELYLQITGNEFQSNDLVVSQIDLSENIILVGLNSNLNINQHGGLGNVDIVQFDEKIKDIKAQNVDKEIFLAFHHNLNGIYEDKQTGQWDPENIRYFVEAISKHELKIVFYGNEHTPRSSKLEDLFYISESGALTSQSPLGTFRCYEIIKPEKKIILKNHLYQLTLFNTILETNGGVWNSISPPSKISTELDEFVILDNTNIVTQVESDLRIPEAVPEEDNEFAKEEFQEVNRIIYNGEYSEKIYQIIKKKKLFQSGHFHWSETSRAHNWIDITKLLENREDLYMVKSAIIDIIESFNLDQDCDLIIGLGYEGNIISSKAAIKYDIPYSSLPYSYRYDEHNDFEKELYFKNEDKKYKNVIIITDVVNDGRTIRKLMKKDNREKVFFDNVEKVTVISLIYSGDRELNVDVLNTKEKDFPKDYDWENDYKDVDNIEYYTVAKLKVEKCPYNNSNYKTECLIYKDKLDCVHLFYDEDKAQKLS